MYIYYTAGRALDDALRLYSQALRQLLLGV